MRVAAIFGLNSSAKHLRPFADNMDAGFQTGLPNRKDEADAILIFGGDGTVHRYLAELVTLQLPVLVVPRGSGNDFARALNLRNVRAALAAWRQFVSGAGNVRKIDLGKIVPIAKPESSSGRVSSGPASKISQDAKPQNGTYFCCVGGIGLDAEITRRANHLPRWIRSRGGYALSLPPALLGFSPIRVQIQAAEPGLSSGFSIRHEGTAILVAFANAPAYGGDIRIAPRAQLDDGKLDVCLVRNMGKARLLRLFPSVYSGGHLRVPEVEYFQTEDLRLETERPAEVYADGEYVGRTPVEVIVEPAALNVIVPAL